MRIVTWNVNSMAARLDFVLDFLQTRSPDIVCVQELKLPDEGFPHLAFEQAGFRALTYGQAQWNGVGVLVRKSVDPEPLIVSTGLPGHEPMGSRLITVKAAGLSVTSAYVPNGKTVAHPDYKAKVAWLGGLADFVEKNLDPNGHTILAGDFNVVPGDLDTWDPVGHVGAIFHTDAERGPLERLRALGLQDLFREKNPDLQSFSWWDYRAGAFHKKQGLRIDLVYGSKSVVSRVREVSIDRDFRKKREGRIPSDHAPVIVDID
ncbi:MAG: exodeoxyribonuclease III [Polyangiaceae bacterium]|nr:exodeoxyribonuclease III [Polyangiaceae bacterium]